MLRAIMFICAVVALCAFMAAYGLDPRFRNLAWNAKARIAAIVGGFLPLLLLALVLAASGDPSAGDPALYIGFLVVGLIQSTVIGYPVAYLFLRRCERSREADVFK